MKSKVSARHIFMKFQCSACGLRVDSLHLKQKGLMNPKLTSICDICRQRGLAAEDYGNPVVKVFAANLLFTYVGTGQEVDEQNFLLGSAKLRKRYEGFLQDFDGNSLVQQQISREEVNRALVACETGVSGFVPDPGLTFAMNLEKMGLKVNFQLNEVDYIDRERIRAKYKYRCQYCGRRGRSVDHKDPVSLSQNNRLDNLILSCQECNRIKSNMPYDLFVKLNDEIPAINQQLVKYENALGPLKEEFQQRRRMLAAKVHLKGVVNDPELNAIRKSNKRLQDAIDSLEADYDALRLAREEHFANGWKLAIASKKTDII